MHNDLEHVVVRSYPKQVACYTVQTSIPNLFIIPLRVKIIEILSIEERTFSRGILNKMIIDYILILCIH